MDKLKPFLRTVKVHQFWFISGAVFLAYMSTWFLVTGSLQSQT